VEGVKNSMMQRKQLAKHLSRRESCRKALIVSASTMAPLSFEEKALLSEINKPDCAGSVSVTGD